MYQSIEIPAPNPWDIAAGEFNISPVLKHR